MTPKEEAIQVLWFLEPNCTNKDLVACTAFYNVLDFEFSCGLQITHWTYWCHNAAAIIAELVQKPLEAWRTR